MLTDDLTSSLQRNAASVAPPAAYLLARVERHADRLRNRRIAIIASISLLALIGAGTGAGLVRNRSSSTVETGPPVTIASIPCDEPVGTPPPGYLDWPCATPADGDTGARVGFIETHVMKWYHLDSTQVSYRLLADTRHDGEADHFDGPQDTVVEAWRSDKTAPAVIVELDGGEGVGTLGGISFNSSPVGDPAIVLQGGFSGTERRVFARPDVANVVLDEPPTSVTVKPDGGVATLHYPQFTGSIDEQPTWHIVGLDANGQLLADVPFDTEQGPPDPAFNGRPATAAPLVSPSGASSGYRQLCEDPAVEGQMRTLDWPCAAPADADTGQRVDAIVAGLATHYASIKKPHVRLLADTINSGEGPLGPAVTEIEIWDNSDSRSAVLATYVQNSPLQGTAAMVIFANDPGIVVDNVSTQSLNLVFVRAGIASLDFHHGTIDERASVQGGVAVLHLPGGYAGVEGWTVTGYDVTGHEVATTPWDVSGCTKTQTSPCNPLATPGPTPTP